VSARRTRARGRHRSGARGGFTLIEVLVALGLTSVVAMGLYTLSLVASQTFQQQQRVSEMQLRLRAAMESVRSDLIRAGYQTTPNSLTDPTVCPRPTPSVLAVSVAAEAMNPTHQPTDNVFIAPARLTIMGNMASTDEYKIGGINGRRVFIQHRWDEWERVRTAQDMQRIFPVGRVVRLRGLDGSTQFGSVTSTTFSDARQPLTNMPSIDLDVPVALTNGMTTGCGLNSSVGWITPVSMVEYRIGNGATVAPNAYLGSPLFTQGRTDLIRSEFRRNAGGYEVIPGSERLVAEYAVDFAIGAVFDEGLGLGSEPRPVRYGYNDPIVFQRLTTVAAGNSRVHQLRALSFRISVRDRAQDADFAWVARANAALPLTRFRVNAALPGAARVRTAASEVSLVNIGSRNLR
jgi:prepilin-type N-terminal cleavage/methylation domain-containing protein